jgi:hypothetical protein
LPLAGGLGEIVATIGLPGGGEHAQKLPNAEVLQAGREQTVDFLVERFREGVL